ncbi:MAG TPA: signal peptidase I [Candidatus Eisenbergiella merdigallinarum]|uniref:Signal peptidase I n=1 Tax=Candidatus Eisenbergiella merdigallinarum TaxID=2838552 RepID=A0A9D2SDP2_9FIRM|nr:signal peptidase I [Candidatus Eisenbergiella merdigallinarum]
MGKTVRKVWNIVSSVIVALAVLLAVALVGVRLVGVQVFAVLSGSMEPAYHTGSLIYVKSVDYTELEEGDVITFLLDEDTVATHRIVEVVPDESDPSTLRFRTKGDANDAEDGGLVHYKNVIGTPVFTIPKLGYAVDYIQRPPGMYVAISAGAILLLLVFLPDLFSGEEEAGSKKKKKRRKPKAARSASHREKRRG